MSYRLAKNVELLERNGDNFLVSANPLSVLRLNDSLAGMIRRGEDGQLIPRSDAEAKVLEQLAEKGFVERLREGRPSTGKLPSVSIVIPVKDRAEELARCLDSLHKLNYPQDKLEIIVVDDGSSDGSQDTARRAGALVVPSGGVGRGPASARNAGAAAASNEILAFIDSDCTASAEWLAELVPSFDDPATAAVGGLVDGLRDAAPLDRYEAVMSSLSLGMRERSGKGGDDTFYLPSCNMLVRRDAFLRVGRFNDGMHVGEDVDLSWRLRDLGWKITYLPQGRVWHEHRSSLRPFMSRRFDYGTSEGLLQGLHPRRRKKMVIPPVLALALALCLLAPLAGWWLLPCAAVILAGDTAVAKLNIARRGLPLSFTALAGGRVRALGSLVYYLSYHLTRYYTLPLALFTLFMPQLGVFAAAAFACAAGVDFAVRKPQLSFARFAGIYLMEQLAYGAGVFWGCLTRKSFASYRLALLRRMETQS